MRINPPSPSGLIATHAALTLGVHGVTGTLVGTTDTQTLTNKILSATSITVVNAGAGADPTITSNSGSKDLRIADYLHITADYQWQSGTAFKGTIAHAISAARSWVFPDVAGNVLIDADTTKEPTFTSVTILNVGAGANPKLYSNHGAKHLYTDGGFEAIDSIISNKDLKFLSSTAFFGTFAHAISANRTWTLPDVAGTVCMWGAVNAAVTRYWSIAGYGLMGLVGDDGTHGWTFDDANDWADYSTDTFHSLAVHLPHGAIVTALRVRGHKVVSGTLITELHRIPHATNVHTVMATVSSALSMTEVSDTSISDATIDNNLYSYYIRVNITVTANEARLMGIQIDYTVTFPYA